MSGLKLRQPQDEQEAQDAIVLGKVVPNANLPNVIGFKTTRYSKPNANYTTSPSKFITQHAPSVNDMAEGETTRNIPTLNQPVVDQAKVLSAAEKQNLEQQIRDIYRQGKSANRHYHCPNHGARRYF